MWHFEVAEMPPRKGPRSRSHLHAHAFAAKKSSSDDEDDGDDGSVESQGADLR